MLTSGVSTIISTNSHGNKKTVDVGESMFHNIKKYLMNILIYYFASIPTRDIIN